MISKAKYREEKQKSSEPMVEHLKGVYDEINAIYKSANDLIIDFLDSEYNPIKVAEKLTESKNNKLDNLVLVHKSMYKLQTISNNFVTKIIPQSEELYSDADISVKTVEKELLFDGTFDKITTSNAEKTREKDFILLYVTNNMAKIEKKYKNIKGLSNFLNDLSSYLNRLDSMIRLQEKLESNSNYSELVTNNTVSQIRLGDYIDD